MGRQKTIILFVFLIISSANIAAQENEDILVPVHNLFKSFQNRDTTLLKTAFVEQPTFKTVSTIKGQSTLSQSGFQNFIKFVGDPLRPEVSEPIWNIQVQRDGDLAQVWCDYAFMVEDRLNHCGVDSFQLIKIDGAWQIFSVVDTRRKADCQLPEEVRNSR